jgi:RNA polymerase sigma factor (sigma-70 family)
MGELDILNGAGASPSSDFDLLLQKVRAGDADAVRQLHDTYGPSILRAVRRRMNAKLRERYDSDDFSQAVWASFFKDVSELGRMTTPRDLVQFLARVASNKVIDAGRRARHRSEEHVDDVSESIQHGRDLRLRVSVPTPSQHAVANESWERILADEEENCREVIRLRLQGLTQLEIAARLRISERSVRRMLLRISRKVLPEISTQAPGQDGAAEVSREGHGDGRINNP